MTSQPMSPSCTRGCKWRETLYSNTSKTNPTSLPSDTNIRSLTDTTETVPNTARPPGASQKTTRRNGADWCHREIVRTDSRGDQEIRRYPNLCGLH